jgi:hypothetical protein
LLLLLLTRFLLAAALLLSALLLTTLLLLARLLVWILIHCTSSPTLVRSAISIACAPWQWTMRGGCIRSRSRARSTLMKMCSELAGGAVSFPFAYRRSELMGRYMLLWLLGVPIPILVLIWLFGGLH